MNLADIIRSFRPNMTRKQLKVARAKLRRAGVTRLHKDTRGAYTIAVGADVVADTRADIGTIVVQVASMIASAS